MVGAYNTPQAKKLATTEIDCVIDAVNGALASAGLAIEDVDGFNVTSTTQRYTAREAVMLFGARPSWTGHDIGIPGVIEAALAISAGLCEVAVIATAQVYAHRERKNTAPWTRPSNEFVECWGLFTPAEFALMARRHMHLYGTTAEQFAEVAATVRNNGARHPEACHYGKFVTPDDVLNSRMIADPFRLFDCCMENDGACAVVITTEERAQDLARAKGRRPVKVVATEQGAPKGYSFGSFTNANIDDEIYATGGTEEMANRLWQKADLKPEDVDVAQIYDHFTGSVLMQFEDFGFCKRGEGGDFIDSGALSVDGGSLPTNTSGGSLSEAYMHGLNHVLEGARSLWGESCNNVDNAEVCLVTSAAGVPSSAILLQAS